MLQTLKTLQLQDKLDNKLSSVVRAKNINCIKINSDFCIKNVCIFSQ